MLAGAEWHHAAGAALPAGDAALAARAGTWLTGYLGWQADVAAARGVAPPAFNFAPIDDAEEHRCWTWMVDGILADAFGTALPWRQVPDAPPEAPRLALDSTLAQATLGWQPRFDRAAMIRSTADWYAAWRRGRGHGGTLAVA